MKFVVASSTPPLTVDSDIRSEAIHRLINGEDVSKIAQSLEISRQTLYRWKRLYEKGGLVALAARPSPGRPLKLTDDKLSKLHEALRTSPAHVGLGAGPWSLKYVARYISKLKGPNYSTSNVSRLLISMGISIKSLRRPDTGHP